MQLLSDNGMSAPAWGFFTALVVMLGGVIVELIRARRKVDAVKEEMKPLTNGFASDLLKRMTRIENMMIDHITETRESHEQGS